MSDSLTKSLASYYCDALFNSYVYSNNLETLLSKNNILEEDWFLDCLEFNIEYNQEFKIYGDLQRKNCYEMISRVLFKALEENDSETVERCNNATRILNNSGKDNYYDYLVTTFIYASANPKRSTKLINSDYVNFDLFEGYFTSLSNVAAYLSNSDYDKVPRILVLDDFAIHALVDISKRIPEVFEDSVVLQKMFNILIVNENEIYKDKSIKANTTLDKENNSTFKYLKKTYKKSLK